MTAPWFISVIARTSSSTIEDPHLRRRPESPVDRPDRQEPDDVAEPPGDAAPVRHADSGPGSAQVWRGSGSRAIRDKSSKKGPLRFLASGLSSGAEGDRTLNLRIANATLSQLSYRPSG